MEDWLDEQDIRELRDELAECARAWRGPSSQVNRLRALFGAVEICGLIDKTPPKWVRNAFAIALSSWQDDAFGSLDQAFHHSPEGKVRRRQTMRRLLLSMDVRLRVAKLKATGQSVDWHQLAKELGSSKTVLQDLYYARSRQSKRKRGKK
jgi:hypothetical protein